MLREKLVLLSNATPTLIELLKKETLPVIIWGGGSLSYNLFKMLEFEGVSVDAFWIDGKKEKEKNGIPILNYDEVCHRFVFFNVVIGHSHYELADEICNRKEINNVFCFVNICYGRWKGISTEFIKNHIHEYEMSYELLEDELSKECFSAYLNCKNNENYRFLLPCCSKMVSIFSNPFIEIDEDTVYLDVGAYDGDTIKEFIISSNGNFGKIIGIEPEKENFKRLREYVDSLGLDNIEIYDNGCWKEDTTLRFNRDFESSGINDEGKEYLSVKRIDNQFGSERISIIKINYLQGAIETIIGAEGILQRDKPKLIITVGFDEWGIIKIPQLVKDINPSYSLFLRYASPMPARLLLFAC